ncbi:trimethylguanosine synthase [Rhagoletis pomonella]|uniref:trimethylguanosine synthase n=1 Tax=Rhagoletis pomonella TaxID=28610 RepID=UPI00177C8631|nr:trimethylguanosine synthase [Rhagoletis pomonella]
MHQYFVETCGTQPRLFVFNQLFKTESNLSFERILSLFEKDYETIQKERFLEFWCINGDIIVNEEFWRFRENGKKSLNPSETETTYFDNPLGTDMCMENHKFWQQYYETVYEEQYQVFAFIFYEYYKHLHYSLEAKEPEIEEPAVNNQDIVDDFDQLELFGLPTAFGRAVTKKKKYLNRNANLHQIYSAFFSDDEESYINMDNVCVSETPAGNHINLDGKVKDNKPMYDIKEKCIEKKKKNRKLRNVPTFLLENKGMLKYWRKRFSLFSRYDDGIRLDCESWFSVTPEKIAVHLADRLSCDLIVDAFCGCGGNSIQFARTCKHVVAIDIDPIKINMAKHNAKIYGVTDKIDFIVGDFLQIGRSGRFRSDVVFLSPPWGGPKYKTKSDYDIERFLQPAGASQLMEIAKTFSENIVFYLPRNACIKQVVKLAGEGNRCEVEHNYLDSRLVAITAIYGENILKSPII